MAHIISVPSSSGKSLQRMNPRTTANAVSYFSPLFIGEVSSTEHKPRPSKEKVDFSPLFIGEVSSTGTAKAGGPDNRAFQSPLHRGSLFNENMMPRNTDRASISVPSSSGKSLQPYQRAVEEEMEFLFQSPLHRGSLFNLAGYSWLVGARNYISVPSSSGKSLQRGKPGLGLPGSCPFQSPLHRGSLFNGLFMDASGMAITYFSPLFIGEVSST